MKKVILPGLLTGLVMLIIGYLLSQLFSALWPSLQMEYQNVSLFRPWSDPLMSLMFVQPFIIGLILALFWQNIKSAFANMPNCNKGLCFGFGYWLIALPGMVMSYGSFPISLSMVLSWTFSILIQALVAGWLLTKLNK